MTKKSKKEKRAKGPMAVTKAGPKSHPVKQSKPKPKTDHVSVATNRDMEKMLFVPVHGEKYLSHSDRMAIEAMFLNMENK